MNDDLYEAEQIPKPGGCILKLKAASATWFHQRKLLQSDRLHQIAKVCFEYKYCHWRLADVQTS